MKLIIAVLAFVLGVIGFTIEYSTVQADSPKPVSTSVARPQGGLTDTPTSTIPVHDVRESNVRDTSFTVSFLTDSPPSTDTLATLSYWISGTITSTRFAADALPTKQTHWFQATGLQPDTQYQYAIALEGSDGRYRGEVRTSPTMSPTVPAIAYGQVRDMVGVPKEGALVYVRREMSTIWLSTFTSNDGSWSIDISFLLASTTGVGGVRALGGGSIFLEVIAPDGEAHQLLYTDFPWPLSLVTQYVPARTMSPGWNLISVTDGVSTTAERLLSSLRDQGIQAEMVVRWQDGGWQSHIRGFSANDFAIESGRGYFVKTTNGGSWRYR